MIGYERFIREEQPRLRARAGTSASASSATSKAPASVRTKARGSRSSRAARCACATGVGTQGQGHFTVFAQIVADVLGVRRRGRAGRHRRHARVPLGHRHVREPRRGGGRQRLPRRRDGGAREDPRPREPRAERAAEKTLELDGGRVNVRRSASDRGSSRSASSPGKANPLRGAVRPGTEPGLESHGVLRPRSRQHGERRARDDRRGGSRDGDGRDQALRRRPRLRHDHQSACSSKDRSTAAWRTASATRSTSSSSTTSRGSC